MRVHVVIAYDLVANDRALLCVKRAIKDINAATTQRLKLGKIEKFDAPPYNPPVPGALVPWHPIYYAIHDGHYINAVKQNNELFLYLISPQYNSIGQAFLYGVGQGICVKPPTLCFATTWLINHIAMQKTRYIIEHELLHLLGATHQEQKRNVMFPGCDIYVSAINPTLPILRTTQREVKKCLGG